MQERLLGSLYLQDFPLSRETFRFYIPMGVSKLLVDIERSRLTFWKKGIYFSINTDRSCMQSRSFTALLRKRAGPNTFVIDSSESQPAATLNFENNGSLPNSTAM